MAPIKPVVEPAKAVPPPTSLLRPTAAAHDYPVSALSPTLAAAAAAIAARTQAPLALAAQAVLSVAAGVAQRQVDVRLPTGETRPVSALVLTLVESGERSGAVEALALAPLRVLEAERVVDPIYEVYREAMEARGRALPRLRPDILREGVSSRGVWTSTRPHSLFVARDCAALVARGTERRRLDAIGLCALWDGARAGARLSAQIVAAPHDARAFLADPALADYGVLGRLLAAYPASRIGARAWAAPDGGSDPAVTAYATAVAEHFAREEPDARRVVTLSAAATDACLAFAREVESEMADGGRLSGLRAFAGHLPEHAVRLAAVCAFFEDPSLSELSDVMIAAGIALARYYAGEALRLADYAAVDAEIEQTDILLAWLQRTRVGRVVSLRDIYREGPPDIRDAETAHHLMRRLERNGAVASRAVRRHGRASYAWEVVPGEPAMSRDVA